MLTFDIYIWKEIPMYINRVSTRKKSTNIPQLTLHLSSTNKIRLRKTAKIQVSKSNKSVGGKYGFSSILTIDELLHQVLFASRFLVTFECLFDFLHDIIKRIPSSIVDKPLFPCLPGTRAGVH